MAGIDCTNPVIAIQNAAECVAQGASNAVSRASDDAVQQLANRVLEGLGTALASVGTMWVALPTPVLTAGSGTTAGQGAAPGGAAFTAILSFVVYIGLALAVLSLVGLGAMIALRARRGEGLRSVGRLGLVLIAVLLISGASALVGALLGATPQGGSSTTVGFLQNSLWFYVGGLAVLSVVIAGIRMAWQQRAQPGKDLLQSLLTLLAVSGAGLTVITLAVSAADAFSVWVLNGATGCDVSAAGESQCFGTNLAEMIGITATSPIGMIGVLVLGSLALLMTYIQVALMVVRGGLLVILAGVLPLTASFTNTEAGRHWFRTAVGWTLAFILYKPAAALVYAAAFSLTGTDAFLDDGGGIWSILTGLALMLMSLIALPALLRFVVPMTGAAVGGGAATGLAVAAGAGAVGLQVASGAISRVGAGAAGAARAAGGVAAAPTGAAIAGGVRAAGAAAGAAAPIAAGAALAGKAAGGAAKAAGGAVRSATGAGN